ncbi:MAG: pyridoxal phosphate-dependent aminotransferase [Nitrososphaera sp.]
MALGMGQEVVSRGISACSHGGIYSVDHRLVRVDCSSSINPLGTPRRAIRAIRDGAGAIAPRYPDPECTELRKSLARYLQVDIDTIAVGNGAVEIIYWFARAFANKRVAIPVPTFCEYELSSQKAGAAITFSPLHEFELDADSVIENAKGADALFLCNPNNPTGTLATREIKKIVESIDSQTKILLDECFIELVDDPDGNSLVDRIGEFENLVILRSLTKSFGLAGLRVGYSVCNPSLARALSANKIPWNVNGLAQAAGIAALVDPDHLPRARMLIKKERGFLRDKVQRMNNYDPFRSDANFFMVRLRDGDSRRFKDAMLKKTGVLVRDCSTFRGMDAQHVRIAVKTRRENLLLIRALETFDRDG